MPDNELQPCPKCVHIFRTRFDKDIAQKNEKPQNIGTKYRRLVDIRKIWRLCGMSKRLYLQYWQVRTARLLYQFVHTKCTTAPSANHK